MLKNHWFNFFFNLCLDLHPYHLLLAHLLKLFDLRDPNLHIVLFGKQALYHIVLKRILVDDDNILWAGWDSIPVYRETKFFNWFFILDIFFSVQSLGLKLFCLAAFSAGILKESHPWKHYSPVSFCNEPKHHQ